MGVFVQYPRHFMQAEKNQYVQKPLRTSSVHNVSNFSVGLSKDERQFLEHVGRNVRRERKRAGIRSMETLADLAGCSRGTVQAVESGAVDTSMWTMTRIAEALQVPISLLLAGYGQSDAAQIAERFAQSDYARLPDVTVDDIKWLATAPVVEWLGAEPSNEAIYQALRVRRLARTRE